MVVGVVMMRRLSAAAIGLFLALPAGPAAADGGDPHRAVPAQSVEHGRSYQVLITFAPDTPPDRITEISSALGVAEQHRAFGRIVLGVAPTSVPLDDVRQAARQYPEVLAVERGSTVRPQ